MARLTRSIPGSGGMAILQDTLVAVIVTPGSLLMIDEPRVFGEVVMSIFIGNLVPFIINQPLIPYTNKVPSNPPNYLIPVILLFP